MVTRFVARAVGAVIGVVVALLLLPLVVIGVLMEPPDQRWRRSKAHDDADWYKSYPPRDCRFR